MSKQKIVMSHDPLADLDEGDAGAPVSVRSPDQKEALDASADEAPGSALENSLSLELPSSLTIADVGEIYALLRDALQQDAEVTLDGSSVDVIDGAGIQLLAALFKEASEKQLTIRWSGASDPVVQAAAQMGLSSVLMLDGWKQVA